MLGTAVSPQAPRGPFVALQPPFSAGTPRAIAAAAPPPAARQVPLLARPRPWAPPLRRRPIGEGTGQGWG